MNIIFITKHAFPYGPAITNRLIAIAKGLIANNCKVTFLCIKPTESKHNIKNKYTKGEFQGIKFIYTSGITVRSRFKIINLLLSLKSMFKSIFYILKNNKQEKIDIFFISLISPLNTFLFYLISKIIKAKTVHERNEYPFISIKKSFLSKINLWIYLQFICKLFDGFIIITNYLEHYFKKYINKNTKPFLLPILVETERFSQKKEKFDNSINYMGYCGSLQGDKDGIPILIDAFQTIAEKIPFLKLYLIGDTSFKGFNSLQEKVIGYNLEDRIIFIGRIERDEMPKYLVNASSLVLARPNNKQAEGGFPTKLGEYLATGKPVIITKVGEIPKYLSDENAFLADPDSADSFAKKITEVYSNYENALKIGQEGKKIADTIFNYKYQSERLIEYFHNL